MTLDRSRFKREVEAELKRREIKRADLAVMCGCSSSTIDNTLYLPVDHVTPTVKKIADKLDLDISYLSPAKKCGPKPPVHQGNSESMKPVITEKPRGDGSVIRTTKTATKEKIEILHPEELEEEKKVRERSMIDDNDEFLKLNDEKIRVNSSYLEKELERQKKLAVEQGTMIAILKKEKSELIEKTKFMEDMKRDLDKTYQEKEALQKELDRAVEKLNSFVTKETESDDVSSDLNNRVMDLSIGSALKLKEALNGIFK